MLSSLNVNFILHSINKRQSIAIISDKTVKIDILTTFIVKDAAMGVCYAWKVSCLESATEQLCILMKIFLCAPFVVFSKFLLVGRCSGQLLAFLFQGPWV